MEQDNNPESQHEGATGPDNGDSPEEQRDAFIAWAKAKLDGAARMLREKGVYAAQPVEARVSWTIPNQVLIGKVRRADDPQDFVWVIAGEDLPTDHAEAAIAAEPRDVARHFALKWHLDAARLEGLDSADGPRTRGGDVDWSGIGEGLTARAEALYRYVDDEEIWSRNVAPDA